MRHSVGPWFRESKNAWYVCHEGRQTSLGVKGEGNEDAARKAWHRLMGGLPVEVAPMPTLTAQKPPTVKPEASVKAIQAETMPGLVKAFLADAEARVKPSTAKWYAGFLTPFAGAFKGTAPDALTVPNVERYSKRAEWSQSSRCDFIGIVASLFKWAVDSGRMERSPIQGIRRPAKQSRGRKALISAEDHSKLVKHAKGDFGAFVQLLWLTGCRPGEVAGLTAQDVDLANRCIILSQHKTAEQTGRDRLIVLPDEAVNILAGLMDRRPDGLLFPGDDGQRMTPQAVTKRMSRLCQRASVKAMSYGYRHSYATQALSQGVPDATVAALLGHSGTTMLHKHYSHLTSRVQVLRDAASKVRG